MATAKKTAATAPETADVTATPAEEIKAPEAAPAAPEAPAADVAMDGLTASDAAAIMKDAGLQPPADLLDAADQEAPAGALDALAKAEAAPAHAQEHAAAVNLGQRLAELKHAIEAGAHHLTGEAAKAVEALYALL